MALTLDARGLACPQPVLLTMEAMKSTDNSEIEVLVDNEASRENVSRAAVTQGWRVTESVEAGDDFKVLIKRK
ncbi:sulfurtransferase TusA family protein [Desulfonatronovibrio magnus]|uniref:sulfurtransferase TusA family protein n=1 Tax=Desulfonatronovibrio magnus TaxID=698827 RepID=UPI0005EB5FD3|nr:sulfurtransferase TusA family protein [Desulfonatronovibrio magnus]